MSRVCSLTGKAVQSGNLVSHSNHKTRRRYLPNLHKVSLYSELLGLSVRLRICARALSAVTLKGGLDAYLLNAKEENLSQEAKRIRKIIKSKAQSVEGAI